MHRIRNDTKHLKHLVIAENDSLSLSNLCTRGKGATSSRNGLQGEAPPERVPFSGFKYIKGGKDFTI